MPRAIRQYVALAVLLALVSLVQSDNFVYLFRIFSNGHAIAAQPFRIRSFTRTISAGEFAGDQLLALNGTPFNSIEELDNLVRASQPGQTIRLTLSQPDGRAVEREITLGDMTSVFPKPTSLAIEALLTWLLPMVALALGFGVALIRPQDGNAWLVLLVMLSFTELIRDFAYPMPTTDLRLAWTAIWNTAWPISLMLLGIYFPHRSARDKKYPWLKWIFGLLFVLVDLGFWTEIAVWRHNVNMAITTGRFASQLYFGQIIVAVMATAGFLANFRRKKKAERSADGCRRLAILRAGTWIALGPVCILAIIAVSTQRDIFARIPASINVTSLLLLTFFPLSLGYVIVVERAMDLRFVVRMGIKYGLARMGLWTARAVLVAVAVYIFAVAITRKDMNWVQPVELTAVAGGLLIIRKRGADSMSQWIDRRFFREAYDSEKVLRELAAEVGQYLDVKLLFERVGMRIGETLHIAEIVILLREGNTFRTAFTTRPGEPMDIAANSRIVTNLSKRNEPLEIYFDKPPLWIRSLDTVELQTLDFMRTQLLLPLAGRDQLSGIISLGPKRSETPYSDSDIRLLQAVAWQTGMALENSRLLASLAEEAAQRERLNTELEIAREVQERLFPQNYPAIEGIDCAGYCRPAQGVGGDYYDFLQLPNGKLGLAVGDVSGKGIAAALLMASLQASLRGQAIAGQANLATLMTNVNRLVYEASTTSRYATFFYAEYDPATKNLSYVNAGHNPPIVLRGTCTIRLDQGGPVVGLLPGARYDQATCQLQSGDVFIGFTDGISEAMTEQDEEWDEPRFIAAARAAANLDPAHMIQNIFKAADAFTGTAKQYDDMTLVVMKIR